MITIHAHQQRPGDRLLPDRLRANEEQAKLIMTIRIAALSAGWKTIRPNMMPVIAAKGNRP